MGMMILFYRRMWPGRVAAAILSILSAGWGLICRLAVSLEAVTMVPVTAMLVMPLFTLLLVRRGYYEILFGAKRKRDSI
jgi:hypothetical protein